jgi:hypothetical protein
MIANFVAGIHKKVLAEMHIKKVAQADLDAFDAKIHKDDGKLDYLSISKLNSVYKKKYVKMVIDDDDAMKHHLADVKM